MKTLILLVQPQDTAASHTGSRRGHRLHEAYLHLIYVLFPLWVRWKGEREGGCKRED